MIGVPIEVSTNVFFDNELVYKNVSTPESVLKKKYCSISYHQCREEVATGTVRLAKDPMASNLVDCFTKMLPRIVKEKLLDCFSY